MKIYNDLPISVELVSTAPRARTRYPRQGVIQVVSAFGAASAAALATQPLDTINTITSAGK